jgi:hypothetical protein
MRWGVPEGTREAATGERVQAGRLVSTVGVAALGNRERTVFISSFLYSNMLIIACSDGFPNPLYNIVKDLPFRPSDPSFGIMETE